LVFGGLMEQYAYVLTNLRGVWQTMQGRRQGLEILDVSSEGVWRSFQAMLVSLPMLWATWISALRVIEPHSTLTPMSIMLRLAFADAVAWLLPIALFALIARPAKLTRRAAHFIVTNNWGAVFFAAITALTVPFDLLGPDYDSLAAIASALALLVSLVLYFRMIHVTLDAPYEVSIPVYAALILASLFGIYALYGALGLTFSTPSSG
jgi:hypothetical protein